MDFITLMATKLFGDKTKATKGQLNDDDKQGKKYINSAPELRLSSQVQEITGMPIRPPQYGMLANRLAKNRERQMGLLKMNPNLRGLLR